jgi:hypothetical protein
MLQRESPVTHAPPLLDVESTRNLLFRNKNLPSSTEKILFFNGYEAERPTSSLDHLLSKHGHSLGSNDTLPPNSNQMG